MAMHKNKVVFSKAYGYTSYDSLLPMNSEMVFDMASVTKTTATTLAVMKLIDEKKLDLNKTLGDYLPWLKNTNKDTLTLRNVILHQAGMVSFIPFYRNVISKSGEPLPGYFQASKSANYSIVVAENMYMRNDYADTIKKIIVESKVTTQGEKYLYSDNDFILLGNIVEQVSGMNLDAYTRKNFYEPLGLKATGFLPLAHIAKNKIVPTEREKAFRQQLLQGHVHDPGAAMMGGIAGHAGLYSTAADLIKIYQMLLKNGSLNGKKYISAATIKSFTQYQTFSRRGYGFDKPEKDNATRNSPYPCKYASPTTFGHTGYTGTCVWADPTNELIYVFLSNRVNEMGGENTKLLDLNIRTRIHDALYQLIKTVK
jgi:beta-N-acetylhexosaminidase